MPARCRPTDPQRATLWSIAACQTLLRSGIGIQDGVAMLWDLAEGKRLYSLDAGDIIHALCFSPNRYWLCAATQSCIKVSTTLLCTAL